MEAEPRFAIGDRVVVRATGISPWTCDFLGTIDSAPTIWAGPNRFYEVAFDEPQWNDDGIGPVSRADVNEKFLRPASSRPLPA